MKGRLLTIMVIIALHTFTYNRNKTKYRQDLERAQQKEEQQQTFIAGWVEQLEIKRHGHPPALYRKKKMDDAIVMVRDKLRKLKLAVLHLLSLDVCKGLSTINDLLSSSSLEMLYSTIVDSFNMNRRLFVCLHARSCRRKWNMWRGYVVLRATVIRGMDSKQSTRSLINSLDMRAFSHPSLCFCSRTCVRVWQRESGDKKMKMLPFFFF